MHDRGLRERDRQGTRHGHVEITSWMAAYMGDASAWASGSNEHGRQQTRNVVRTGRVVGVRKRPPRF